MADEEVLLYTIVGSQFGAKVLTALDALGVPYKVVEVHPTKLKKVLVPPHTAPQLRWRGTILTDSADILAALDRDLANPPFRLYPPAKKVAVQELEAFVGSTLNAFVLYFAWWVQEGYEATYERLMLEDFMPLCASVLPLPVSRRVLNLLVDTGRIRGSYRKKARAILGEGLIPSGRQALPDEGPRLKAALVKAVEALDARFVSSKQLWVCATDHPSAADFALYGILERFIGNEGDANLGAATPWLFREARVEKLRSWHQRMQTSYPIVFRGKTAVCRVWSKM